MSDTPPRRRCAVYTRKSNEEGLEQEYNSIAAQRDAGHAYIASQCSEGWTAVGDDYDDPAFSGGNMDRPALKKLMTDIEAGKIDVVVVYKIDRLTRSLADFARMIEIFERQKVSFVSVTQQFSTTTSMGRLMLNVLLSFAQFEREVTGERIRDKIAASKRKGMWMGGVPPLGYDVKERRLIINAAEAELVRHIFLRFVHTGSTTKLVAELRKDGARTKSWRTQDGKVRMGNPIDKGNVYKMLHNRHYLGEISHGKTWYPAQHEAVVKPELWDAAHTILASNGRTRANHTRGKTLFLLRGLVVAEDGRAMTTSSNRNRFGRVYRYYIGIRETKECAGASGLPRIPAAELESAVMAHLRNVFRDPKLVPAEQRAALVRMDAAWVQIFPEEQERIVRKLVQRVVVRPDGINIQLRPGGIAELAQEFGLPVEAPEMADEACA